jgi:hypothetical protein
VGGGVIQKRGLNTAGVVMGEQSGGGLDSIWVVSSTIMSARIYIHMPSWPSCERKPDDNTSASIHVQSIYFIIVTK